MSLDTSIGDRRSDTFPAYPAIPDVAMRPVRTGESITLKRQPNVLGEIYALVQDGAVDAALDVLYDVVDGLLVARSTAQCDRVLANLDLERAGVDVTIGALSITLPARASLPGREAFFDRVRSWLGSTHAPADVATLLSGLR